MKKWEYFNIYECTGGAGKSYENQIGFLNNDNKWQQYSINQKMTLLNGFGAEGWELVTIICNSNNNRLFYEEGNQNIPPTITALRTYFFKREL